MAGCACIIMRNAACELKGIVQVEPLYRLGMGCGGHSHCVGSPRLYQTQLSTCELLDFSFGRCLFIVHVASPPKNLGTYIEFYGLLHSCGQVLHGLHLSSKS